VSKFSKLSVLEKKLEYTFKQADLLKQALTHKSANHLHNERLEFLGDAVLNVVIADILYRQFGSATEGELTRARASLVNKATLSQIGFELALDEFIELGIGEKRSGGFRRASILADAVEAILGAVHLDGGFEACYQVIQRQYTSRVASIRPDEQKKDPKTFLQEWLQANHHPLPKYEITSIKGEPHEQLFTVSCTVEAFSLTVEGVGLSRRIAEQEAAQKILEQLKSE
jgi:ribonuclease III